MRKPPFLLVLFAIAAAGETVLFPAPDVTANARAGAAVSAIPGGAVEARATASTDWTGVNLAFPAALDLSAHGLLTVVVSNTCAKSFRVNATLQNGAPSGRRPSTYATLTPGATRALPVRLWNAPWVLDAPLDLPGMKDAPKVAEESVFDLSACTGFSVTFDRNPDVGSAFAVVGATLSREPVAPATLPASTFLPFVDRYGQFSHADWPLKIHSDADLAAAAANEEAWLAGHAQGPTRGVDRFGGWRAGPRLAATGRFRAEKRDGRWWIVDPDGRLFFSLGIDCVYANGQTQVAGREGFFSWLPNPGDPLFSYDALNVAGGAVTRADFSVLNQLRKFGTGWRQGFADLAARRLRAWGINTIANWSADYARAPRRIPYTMQFNTAGFTNRLALAGDGDGVLPDVFHADFPAYLRGKAAEIAEWVGDDPMCLGVFVDNELRWDLAEGAADFPGYAERYFAEVEAALRETMPGYLYLGCRFAWESRSREEWRAAARHCDVVSFNRYERAPARDLPADAEDRPLLVGEFSFGAFDSGMFSPGLCPAYDQRERGDCYRAFARQCLDSPRLVGAHWFQYQDQALTGRVSDGENYQMGFVTSCDVPYPEMVDAAREIAGEMYYRRAGEPDPARFAFARSQEITFPRFPGGEALEDFPALVRLSEGIRDFRYADFALPNGGDLRFFDAEGDLLPHEIDTWDTNGESLVWVKVPSLDASAVVTAKFGCGEPPAVDPRRVWDNGYAAVWHMGAAAGSLAQSDSTASGITLALYEGFADNVAPGVAGAVGAAAAFGRRTSDKRGAYSHQDGGVRKLDGFRNLTLELWTWQDAAPSVNGYLVSFKDGSQPQQFDYRLKQADNGKTTAEVWNESPGVTNELWSGSFDLPPLNQWNHQAFRYDGDAGRTGLFLNGTNRYPVAKEILKNPLVAISGYWYLGNYDDRWTARPFMGSIDEVRVSRVARSDVWIRASHDTVADTGFALCSRVRGADSKTCLFLK